QNPHLKGQTQALAEYLRANPGLKMDSPLVRREWFGAFEFDSSATAYRYDKRCAWTGITPEWCADIAPGRMRAFLLPPGVDVVSIGIDPGGAADRFAIVVLGWNSRKPKEVWQLAEWVTTKGTPVSWDVASAVLDVFATAYPVAYYHYDGGGSSNELALFSRVSGRYLLKAAAKADLRGQVEHVATLIGAGRFHPIAGGELERDLELSAWDQVELAAGRHRWSSVHHPDPADAARYAAQPFFALAEAIAPPRTEEQIADELVAAYVAAQRRPSEVTANDLPRDLMGGYGDL
ncbi:MAG TPA: hypothetical protein VLZ78_07835, partial [Terrimesophilobacter sp.]|nr:hypothetical protein [Terrimesophilobacter sp.]